MRLPLCLGALACAGCFGIPSVGGAPDPRGLEAALGAAASLGLVSSAAVNVMTAPVACASVTKACTTFPCDGAVTISLGGDCPLPLGGAATGTVNVTGKWQSATSATLSSTFVNAVAGGRSVVVASATNLTVTRSTNGSVSLSYVGQNVNVNGAHALGAQSSWMVGIDSAGTYTISGTDQAGGGGGSASQLSATDIVLSPSCRLNPISGSATIQQVNGLDIKQGDLHFHAACDGKADSTPGGSINLQFLN